MADMLDNNEITRLKERVRKVEAQNAELQRENERLKRHSVTARQYGNTAASKIADEFQVDRNEAVEMHKELLIDYENLRQLYINLKQQYVLFEALHNAFVAGVVGKNKALMNNAMPAATLDAFRFGVITSFLLRLGDELQAKQQLIEHVQAMNSLIYDGLTFIIDDANKEREILIEKAKTLEELAETDGLTYIANSWLDLLDFNEELDQEDLDDIANEKNEGLGADEQQIGQWLRLLIFMARAAERARLSNEILDAALLDANDLRTVTHDIYEQLEQTNKVTEATLARLPLEWRMTLRSKPQIKTLKQGLERAHKWYREGKPDRLTFAELHAVGESTLKNNISWYGAIVKLANGH